MGQCNGGSSAILQAQRGRGRAEGSGACWHRGSLWAISRPHCAAPMRPAPTHINRRSCLSKPQPWLRLLVLVVLFLPRLLPRGYASAAFLPPLLVLPLPARPPHQPFPPLQVGVNATALSRRLPLSLLAPATTFLKDAAPAVAAAAAAAAASPLTSMGIHTGSLLLSRTCSIKGKRREGKAEQGEEKKGQGER